jgi:hypothetical protein
MLGNAKPRSEAEAATTFGRWPRSRSCRYVVAVASVTETWYSDKHGRFRACPVCGTTRYEWVEPIQNSGVWRNCEYCNGAGYVNADGTPTDASSPGFVSSLWLGSPGLLG